jgi:hypothetical protein
VAAALIVQAEAQGTGIVCWTDEHGSRSCGDHVPPQYATKEREVFDGSGRVTETLKAEETPEERAEREGKEQQAARDEKQRQNDAFMLQTYRNADDIKAVRDNRLQAMDTRIGLAQKAVHDGDATLQDLQDRADAQRSAGQPPDPALLAQIRSYQESQVENTRVLAEAKKDRDTTAAQFDRDLKRYSELRGASISTADTSPQH